MYSLKHIFIISKNVYTIYTKTMLSNSIYKLTKFKLIIPFRIKKYIIDDVNTTVTLIKFFIKLYIY